MMSSDAEMFDDIQDDVVLDIKKRILELEQAKKTLEAIADMECIAKEAGNKFLCSEINPCPTCMARETLGIEYN